MGEVTFNVKCIVQYMQQPIMLGVSGECLQVKAIISYENTDGQRIDLKSTVVNEIQLKPVLNASFYRVLNYNFEIFKMVPYQKEQIVFAIANAGKTGFYFIWSVNTELYSEKVKFNFKDQEGYVKSDSETQSVVSITPLKNILLKGVKIKLQVNLK